MDSFTKHSSQPTIFIEETLQSILVYHRQANAHLNRAHFTQHPVHPPTAYYTISMVTVVLICCGAVHGVVGHGDDPRVLGTLLL